MSNLERIIRKNTKIAQKGDGLSVASIYSQGIIDALGVVKEVRDGLKEEADELWETRAESEAPDERKRSVRLIRAIIARIDSIEV